MKRLLRGNLGPLGNLNNDRFAMAIMQYRNTPVQSTGISPAIVLFGRHLRNFIPLSPGNYAPSPHWLRKLIEKENKQARAHLRERAKWSEHARQQEPLEVGHLVSVQNLVGNYPLKWEKTGTMVEVRQYDQYGVKLDGSNRITYRNRRNLVIGYKKPQAPFLASTPQLLLGGRKEKQGTENTRPATPIAFPRDTPDGGERSPNFHKPVRLSPKRFEYSPSPVPTITPSPSSTHERPLVTPGQDAHMSPRRIVASEVKPMAPPAIVSVQPDPTTIH